MAQFDMMNTICEDSSDFLNETDETSEFPRNGKRETKMATISPQNQTE